MISNRTSESLHRLAGFAFMGFFYVTPVVHFWVEILHWLSIRPFAQRWILNGPGGKGEKSQEVRRALLQVFVDQLTGAKQNQNRQNRILGGGCYIMQYCLLHVVYVEQ